MRVSVIGCGYLGAVHAAGMASLGHEVVGIDVDDAKIERLSRGEAPFFEPGLPEMLLAQIKSGRLTFSTNFADVANRSVHFIAVGTPQRGDSDAADMRFVDAATESLLPHLRDGDVVVGKSTVPVGTARRLAERIARAAPGASLIWNPEFLREGFAIEDTLTPDRLVYGTEAGEAGERAAAVLDDVYRSILATGVPRLVSDFETSDENAERKVPDLTYCDSVLDAVRGAEVTIIATEWGEFRELDPCDASLREAVGATNVLDARNCLDRHAWRRAGWTVRSPGRPDQGTCEDSSPANGARSLVGHI